MRTPRGAQSIYMRERRTKSFSGDLAESCCLVHVQDEQRDTFWVPDPLVAEEEKRLAEESDAEEVAESALVDSEVCKYMRHCIVLLI